MIESEIHSAAPSDLKNRVESLQRQVTLLLLALIIVSGTLAFYLFYQSLIWKRDLAKVKPEAEQIIKNYNDARPKIEKFVQQLQAYGQTHPEFQPILRKYGIAPTNSPAKK